MTQDRMLASMLVALALAISGCDSRPFENYSNYELSQEYQACQRDGLSPAGAQRCNNIIRECEIRKEERNFRC